MKNFNLYKLGRYGWFHITSNKFNSLNDAIEFYKCNFNIKIGKNISNYKVTGL